MYRKIVSTVMLVLFVTSMLLLAIKIQALEASEITITSYGSISASAKTVVGLGYSLYASNSGAPVGVYLDVGCTQSVDSINWGTLQLGGAQEVEVYVRNEGIDTFYLNLTAQDWQPGNASQWLDFSWSCQNITLAAGHVVKVTQTVQVPSDFQGGFSSFSFNIVFQGGPCLLGDITHDGKVGLRDLAIVAAAYGSRPGDPNWNPAADLNKDGVVNLLDLMIVAEEYGQTD